ncbi:MAG: hypothetical protein ABWZ39_10435 [Pseudomonas caspiana]
MRRSSILESDWKLLSKLKPLAVDRLYNRVLLDAQAAICGEGKNSRELVHETRVALNNGIKRVRDVFDSFNFSRSHAETNLMLMCRAGLLNEQEIFSFSEELRERALRWLAEGVEFRAETPR